LEEKSEHNGSISSIGPSPSVIYRANDPESVYMTSDPSKFLATCGTPSVSHYNFGSRKPQFVR